MPFVVILSLESVQLNVAPGKIIIVFFTSIKMQSRAAFCVLGKTQNVFGPGFKYFAWGIWESGIYLEP